MTAQASPSPVAGIEGLQRQLKEAVAAAQPKLGNLEEWQKKLFIEEVVPQYRYFSDYQPTGKGLNIEVNESAIRRFLAFYAPKELARSNLGVGLFINAEQGCAKCTAAASFIRKSMKDRLERRGFAPWFVSIEEVGDPNLLGKLQTKALEDRVVELSQQKNSAGAVVVHLRQASATVATGTTYQVRLFLAVGPTNTYTLKEEAQQEVLENEGFDPALGRLVTEVFTDLGTNVGSAPAAAKAANAGEIELTLAGFRDFAEYSLFRDQIRNRLSELGLVEERVISRGQVVFAIKSNKSVDEIKAKLQKIAVNSRTMVITNTTGMPNPDEHGISAEIK